MNTPLTGIERAALRSPARHQPIVEIAQAYADLQPDIRAQLQQAFAGELDMHDTHALACHLVWRVEPTALAYVIARLICMAEEPQEADAMGDTRPVMRAGEVDIEIPLPPALVLPQEC
jgi:hypothetical protein